MPSGFTKMFAYKVDGQPRIMLAHKVAESNWGSGSSTTWRLTPFHHQRPASGWRQCQSSCGVCGRSFDTEVAARSLTTARLWLWRLLILASIGLAVLAFVGSMLWLFYVGLVLFAFANFKLEREDGLRVKRSSEHQLKYSRS